MAHPCYGSSCEDCWADRQIFVGTGFKSNQKVSLGTHGEVPASVKNLAPGTANEGTRNETV